jgi:RNA polymerase sigma-70 factor (ECF subfamily)
MHHHNELPESVQCSDEYLLHLALQGNAGSFGELVRRWERRIFGFIRRYVGDSEDARDLTQNTFTKAYLNLRHLSDPSRFSSWLYKIAVNECRMRLRSRSRRPTADWEENTAAVERGEQDRLTPEVHYQGREQLRRLEAAFRMLPREQQEVILMKEFQGMKFQHIAEALDIPLSTAKSRLYLGLRTLRRLVEDSHDL